MVITDFLERNARLYGQDISLVEINPSEERDKAATWWDFNLIESASQDAPYRREMSWKDFDRRANRFANLLLSRGLKRGTKVAILLMNCLEWLPIYFGILKAGAVAVPLNFRYTGELIALAIARKEFVLPVKVFWRFIIWGFIGVWITFMMKVYSIATSSMMASGLFLGGDNVFLRALYTSVLMNTSFGPTFMAVHKITDKMLELFSNKEKGTLSSIIKGIDWPRFWGFTILKTVPLFWIPAHTITFLLLAEYQVMMAVALSVALGIILSLGNRNKKESK